MLTKPSQKNWPGSWLIGFPSLQVVGRSCPGRPKSLRLFGAPVEKRNLPKFIDPIVEVWWAEFLGLDFLALR